MNYLLASFVDVGTITLISIFLVWHKIPFIRRFLPWISGKMKKDNQKMPTSVNLIMIFWIMGMNPSDILSKSVYCWSFISTVWFMIRREHRMNIKAGSTIPEGLHLFSLVENLVIDLDKILSKGRPLIVNCGSCT
jgi:hypothetical protein